MKRSGFSLVELAIVLVIIGLITGGILTGQDLIRASELNSVQADVNKFKTAVNTFRIKYNGLPGDLINAESYWGQVSATAATCFGTSSGTATTCNGNGNGIITYDISLSPRANESFRFWQHLSNAGLIPGSFLGRAGGAGVFDPDLSSTPNIPASRISGTGYSVNNPSEGGWTATNFLTNRPNFFMFGALAANGSTTAAAISNADARSIDAKTDDALPGTGNVQTGNNSMHSACATTNVSSTAAYTLSSSTSQACVLIFKFNN